MMKGRHGMRRFPMHKICTVERLREEAAHIDNGTDFSLSSADIVVSWPSQAAVLSMSWTTFNRGDRLRANHVQVAGMLYLPFNPD